MSRITLVGLMAVLCLTAMTIAVGKVSDQAIPIQPNRAEVTSGIRTIPSNPPTPSASGTRDQFLWEDFEGSVFPPPGWDTLNLNTGYGWFLGTYTGGGTQCAMVTWDQTDPVTLQDEWLITPDLDVSSATANLRVEFYMLQGYTYPHDFKVYVTDNDGDTWTEAFDSYGTGYPAHQWYFVSVPLTDYVGSSAPIRIGFQYYGTDADLFGLDNIEVTDDDLAVGRCCFYDDPLNPTCQDSLTQSECNDLGGIWTEGLDCATNPCPILGTQLEPSDDMYTDPDVGSGHSHPIDLYGLWTADFSGANHHERAMIKWDLSAYEGQSIDSAFLNIYRYMRCPNDYYTYCDLYVITEDWDEDTWDEYTHISHESSFFNSYNFGPALGWFRVEISDVVDQWLAGSLENYGIVLQARSGQKWSKFYSKEGTYPPYLEVYGLSSVNQCPVLDPIGDRDTPAGDTLELTITASDPDQTIPNLYCSDLPSAATFIDNQNGTGAFAWLPTEEQVGDHIVLFYADDGQMADSEYVTIHVLSCCDMSGDANGDENVNVSDAVYIINYVFVGGPPPVPCP